MRFLSTLSIVSTAFGLVAAAPQPQAHKRSPKPEFKDGKYIVGRQAEFAHHAVYDFADGFPASGLEKSNYPNDPTRTWSEANLNVRDGYLELLVNGGQTSFPYIGAEITTTEKNIKYASVRTTAILTEPWGVCNGMFFYKGDDQETDIEWLSDPNNLSNQGTRKLWLTNQDTNGDGKTYLAIDPPANPTTTEHEYRLDWTEGRVVWYVDGEQVWETTSDVPSVPGPWVWNNWSNGDNGWSAGPPAEDAIFKIRKIELYYNTA